ncbi:GIY-YIG nuclease family protein [Candidatus Uhrbacteria bacterium]|nr:GIY-YIG nuclease family protein [Candidatus Uhrbacteria bacterium]
MGFLYILYSQRLNLYYVGSTSDPSRRISEHQRGQTPSTAQGCPWGVELVQSFPSIHQAKSAEQKLKLWKSRRIIEFIIRDGKMSSVG